MNKLPIVSWREVVKALGKAGFVFDRQRGSHMVYYHSETNATVVVPRKKEIKRGTLMQILRQANLTREDFQKMV